MHCTGCEYPLWNLKDRRCPECGKDFLPSQFKFVPRSVKFLCSHCDQQYYGTGVDGHLVPRSFECVSCGQQVDMDEMVLLPAEGLETEHTRVGVNPWIDKQRRGIFGRYFATLGKSLGAPTSLIESTPVSSSTGRAVLFAAITLCIGPLFGGLTLLMVFAVVSATGGGGRGGAGGLAPGAMMVSVVPLMAVGLGVLAVWLLGWILSTHFLLLISGRTAGGFRRTVQCMCYSAGPTLMTAVPCFGGYLYPVALIWQMITGSIMVAKGQRISGLRATLAVISPPLVVGTIVLALFVWAITVGVSAAATAASQAQSRLTMSLQGLRVHTVGAALDDAAAPSGQYPAHAVELLVKGLVGAGEFSLSSDPLAADAIIVGSTTMDRLTAMSESARAAAIEAIAKSQPLDVVAHRVGDYVFTYHGMTPASDRGLWLFIAESPPPVGPPPNAASPSPTFGAVRQLTNVFVVRQVDGTMTTFPRSAFDAALATQNELRASIGLSPIPDLSTITPASPVTSPK